MKTTRTKAAGQQTNADATARPKLGTLASIPLSQDAKEPEKDSLGSQVAEFLSLGLTGSDKYWGARVKLPKEPAEMLDDALRDILIDLSDYEEKHPSERARLATNLIRAARQLLLDEQDETVRAVPASADGRTKLAHGTNLYLKARGKPFSELHLTWSIGSSIQRIRFIIKETENMIDAKCPGASADPEIRAAVISYIISEVLWDHENWSTFRKFLRQKKQPTSAPDTRKLADKIEGIFNGNYASPSKPQPPNTWPDLAARVLAAAVRIAGGDDRFADNILRGERGTPKGEKSGSVDSPRKKSGSVDSALLSPRRKSKG